MSLGEREAELLDTLEAVIDAELPYVLVGGWAIAAFNQRFTTDIDVVVPGQALDGYTELLIARGYEKTADVARNELDISSPATIGSDAPQDTFPRAR